MAIRCPKWWRCSPSSCHFWHPPGPFQADIWLTFGQIIDVGLGKNFSPSIGCYLLTNPMAKTLHKLKTLFEVNDIPMLKRLRKGIVAPICMEPSTRAHTWHGKRHTDRNETSVLSVDCECLERETSPYSNSLQLSHPPSLWQPSC